MMPKKKTILFNGHDFKFLRPLISHYQSHPDFEVLFDEHKGHVVSDPKLSAELLPKADIIFCEWCLGNAEWYSQRKLPHQLLVVRLHHQEVGLDYLNRIDWSRIDKLVFICQNNMRLFLEKFPQLAGICTLIYNLFDCQALDLQKLPGAEFNLGFIGSSPRRKAPHLAVELLMRLKEIDNRYTLFIKGSHPWEYDWLWRRKEERDYYESLYGGINGSRHRNSVIFDPHGKDMADWFSKIGFLLSTSEHEGSHQAVAEGMASGAIPVIRNWDGADQIYPGRFVFKDLDEAVELIVKWRRPEHYLKEAGEVRRFARESFHTDVIIEQYRRLLDGIPRGQ